ncbi:hypothetical protein FRE64_15165 [Euhalothece natronophila Z-M001]|uniref:Uncharacterized protein n=1 Tax=Euhalothece natronophila Z-M001 TaxID=522448 RepID=A0A5B8NSC6_9CHRO|nr:hypothetical protein FRE64_15165 [Euhalothece natronophila Z-M001]
MNSLSSLTLRLRTKDNLMELLLAGKSEAWKICKNKEQEISKVEIFNWDGSLKLEEWEARLSFKYLNLFKS